MHEGQRDAGGRDRQRLERRLARAGRGSRARSTAAGSRRGSSPSPAGCRRRTAPRLELGEHEQRPEDDERDDERGQRARAPPGRAAAPAAAPSPPSRRSLAAGPLQHDDVGRRARVVDRRRRPAAAARGLRSRRARAASRVVTAAVGRSKTISPPFMPMMRGNHFSARSTACSEATSVAPRRLALPRPARRTRSVGERRVERRHRLVGEDQRRAAGTARGRCRRAAAGRPRAGRSDRRRARRGRAAPSAARAPAASPRHEQRGERLPRRPGAEPAGEHGGDDAQARRDRRALVHDADARAQAPQRAGAEPPRVVVAEHLDAALARPQRRAEDAQQRRLAGARRADHRDALAARRARATTPCSARWPLGWTRPTPSSDRLMRRRAAYLIRPADSPAASMPS